LAAWRWIAARLEQRPAARVIFLYPTRATAKEGFRDYVSWAPEADVALMHGTSAYDLDGMFANEPNDPRSEANYEVDRRLFALGYWTRRVFSATVDQFLAFLQYAYGPICMLPVLADSVLVIDEVHSFDRSMFSALKSFLQTFDLPVLCMTATLRQEQQDQLQQCGLRLYNERPEGLREIASAPRYRVRRTTTEEALALVRQAIAEEKRVMWVVNQVKRAQQTFLKCRKLGLDVPMFCYHSRFRLMDRRRRHDEVVQAFRPDSPPSVAITTQVCEMSLDMDADILITERCPITSLIQRMGRCHRDRKLRPGAGVVYVYQPFDERGQVDTNPYDDEALTGIDEFLTGLCGRDRVSQMDLEEALAAAPQPPAHDDELSSFLKSGPYAMGQEESFRDIENFTVSAVLASDVDSFANLQKKKEPTDGLIVPVPRWLGRDHDPLGRVPFYVAVVKSENYHPVIGFCDKSELVDQLGGLR
jgi:CRISPR-associated endonuclease/helicase Cas3